MLIRGIADNLQERGHYVRIIAPRPKELPKLIPKDILLVGNSTEFNTPFATKADLSMSVSNEKIDELFAEQKFDILHFHEPGVPVLSTQLLSRSKSVNIATMHATMPEGMVSKSFQKIMLPYAKNIDPKIHLVTAVSESAKRTALAYSPNREVTIIPNAVDLAKFRPKTPRNVNTKSKTIVYVGRLEKRKGASYLIDAYAELAKHHNDTKLFIIGDGNLRKSLETQVAKLKVPNVKFLGFVSEKKKIDYLQKTDLFVSPALFGESFGIVLVEAMAAGSVVLAGNNPGYQSVMVGTGRLSLVNPKSTQDFWQRMELLLYDEQIRELWLEWSYQEVEQYDYSIITSMYEDIYKKGLKQFKDNK